VQVAIAWGIGLAVLLGTGRLAVLGGFAADVSSTLTAAYFLLVPVVLARRQGLEPADFLGLHGRRAGRALLAFLLVAAVVFPPYVAAFAGWSRFVEDRPMRLPSRPWTDYPSEVRGRPDLAGIGPSVVAWTQEDVLYVLNASPDPVQATVRGCEGTVSGLSRRDGRVFLRESDGVPAPDGTIAGSLAPDTGWRCRLAGPFLAALDGPHAPWRTGESLRAPGGDAVDADRSLGWILELVLVHLLVIALPEETFYRGFVQARLAPLFRRRVRILGADVGGHVVIASALFALSHLVAIPAPFRLAVFFPGLLFGWLRERTGSLVAPIVLHCASNVLLAVLVRFQGV
jgi:membrane protease YdiL (CAAX protease family)